MATLLIHIRYTYPIPNSLYTISISYLLDVYFSVRIAQCGKRQNFGCRYNFWREIRIIQLNHLLLPPPPRACGEKDGTKFVLSASHHHDHDDDGTPPPPLAPHAKPRIKFVWLGHKIVVSRQTPIKRHVVWRGWWQRASSERKWKLLFFFLFYYKISSQHLLYLR